jgi:hypothetical protein
MPDLSQHPATQRQPAQQAQATQEEEPLLTQPLTQSLSQQLTQSQQKWRPKLRRTVITYHTVVTVTAPNGACQHFHVCSVCGKHALPTAKSHTCDPDAPDKRRSVRDWLRMQEQAQATMNAAAAATQQEQAPQQA